MSALSKVIWYFSSSEFQNPNMLNNTKPLQLAALTAAKPKITQPLGNY